MNKIVDNPPHEYEYEYEYVSTYTCQRQSVVNFVLQSLLVDRIIFAGRERERETGS